MTEGFCYPHQELTRVPADLSKFWVITCLSNPARFRRRYELYWRFAEMCQQAGVKLITVEQAFGDRQFMVTSPNNPYHLQLRSIEELWVKENLINLGVKHACRIAPGEVREVAWVDADCRSTRTPRDWFEETWHMLQHYQFVQMWEWLIDLDIHFSPIGSPQPGFMSTYIKYGTPTPDLYKTLKPDERHSPKGVYQHRPHYPSTFSNNFFGRPGLAWAANIEAFNHVGGLIDFCILGAADYYQAHGLIGTMSAATNEYIRKKSNSRYAEKLFEWQERALYWIKKDVGYVSGTVYHDFHGNKSNRQYGTRGKILIDNRFNPDTDLKYDSYGQLQLETRDARQIKLRDQIRAYFHSRNEDQVP